MTQYSVIENFPITDIPVNTFFIRFEPWEFKYLLKHSQFSENTVIRVDERIKCITFIDFKFEGDVYVTLSEDNRQLIVDNPGTTGFCMVSLQDRFNTDEFVNVRSINNYKLPADKYILFYNMTVDMSRHKYLEDCEMDVWKKFRPI